MSDDAGDSHLSKRLATRAQQIGPVKGFLKTHAAMLTELALVGVMVGGWHAYEAYHHHQYVRRQARPPAETVIGFKVYARSGQRELDLTPVLNEKLDGYISQIGLALDRGAASMRTLLSDLNSVLVVEKGFKPLSAEEIKHLQVLYVFDDDAVRRSPGFFDSYFTECGATRHGRSFCPISPAHKIWSDFTQWPVPAFTVVVDGLALDNLHGVL